MICSVRVVQVTLVWLVVLCAAAMLSAGPRSSLVAQDADGQPAANSGGSGGGSMPRYPEDEPLAQEGDEEIWTRTLPRCRQMALSDSFTLKKAELQPRIEAANRTVAEAQFDWILTASTRYARVKDQSLTSSVVGNTIVEFSNDTHVESWTNSIGLSRYFDTGTTASITWNYNKNERDVLNNLSVRDSTGMELAVSQNLLKGFGTSVNNYSLSVSAITAQIKESLATQTRQELLFNVEQAFWNLVFAHEDLKVTANTTRLARKDFDIAQRKRQAGLATDIDVVDADKRLKDKEGELYERQKAVRDTSDALLALIAPQRLLELARGASRLIVMPGDYQSTEADVTPDIDVQSAVEQALRGREEIRQAGLTQETSRLTVEYQQNQALPDLTASAGFNFGGQGGNIGGAFDSFGRTDQVDWFMGLEFSVPLGQKEAEGNLEKARQQQKSAEYDKRLAEVQVVTEVLGAIRELQTAIKAQETRRVAENLAQRQVEAAEERVRRGLTTRFEVDTMKSNLDAAQRDRLQSWVRVRIAGASLRKAIGTLGSE